MGSAHTRGRLRGAAPRDWTAVAEPLTQPLHETSSAAMAPLAGLTVLDAGCGTGLAMPVATSHGAHLTGIDAAPAMLALTRERLPDADLHVGDIQHLPFDNDRFDVVTAFKCRPVRRRPRRRGHDMARVTRPAAGSPSVSGANRPAAKHTRCSNGSARSRRRHPAHTRRWRSRHPRVVEELLSAAGLTPAAASDVPCPFVDADRADRMARTGDRVSLVVVQNRPGPARLLRRRRAAPASPPATCAAPTSRTDSPFARYAHPLALTRTAVPAFPSTAFVRANPPDTM